MNLTEVDKLLSAAWLGATLICVTAAIPMKLLHPLRSLVLACCRRGKLLSSSSERFTVPQSWFTHFYIVGTLWTSLLLAAALMSSCLCTLSSTSHGIQVSALVEQFTGAGASAGSGSIPLMVKQQQRGWSVVFLLLLMELQVSRRLYESTNVFTYSPHARMHILAYLVGIFFYVAAPLSLCSQDFGEMMVNFAGTLAKGRIRSMCAWHSEHQLLECFQYLWKVREYQWLGGLLFLWGWFHQYKCHQILASLRSEDGSEEELKTYSIPHGDWFEMVSSAHYLSEIVMYLGFVCASGGQELTLWLLLGWVVSNLYLAAMETHEWYHATFENYPKNRKALIPFLC